MPSILVVDDEPDIRGEICDYLGRQGYDVHAAAGVEEARSLFERQIEVLDYVLTDVRMPDGTGLDLVRFVRQHPAYHGRCLLMTGHLETTETPDAWRDEVPLLAKPFSFRALKGALQAPVTTPAPSA